MIRCGWRLLTSGDMRVAHLIASHQMDAKRSGDQQALSMVDLVT
jgi:hypothetical protein